MIKASNIIQFHYLEKDFRFLNRNKVKAFLEKRFKKEKRQLNNIQYIFCSDDYLLKINQDFLQHNYYTDIISFELSPTEEPVIGEIYISIDRIKENAKQHGESFQRELHRVIFHGALHFCGYKDKLPSESRQMRSKEEEWLSAYFNSVPRGTK